MGHNAQAIDSSDKMDDEIFSDLSPGEREDSLTRALCLGDTDILERGRELGLIPRGLDAWVVSLALRDSSERSIKWLLEGADWSAFGGGRDFWSRLKGHAMSAGCWSNNAVELLEQVLAPKFGDSKWVAFCQDSAAINSTYWDQLFERRPWTAILGNGAIAKGKLGGFGSWPSLMAALGEGGQEEASAAAITVSTLMCELSPPSTIQGNEVARDILRAASNRLFNGRGLLPIVKSLMALPRQNLEVGLLGNAGGKPVSWEMASGFARHASSSWRQDALGAPQANVGFLALAIGRQDDLELALSHGWISNFPLAAEGNAELLFEASPVNALLLCRSDEVFVENRRWSNGKEFEKFKALLAAGFSFDSGDVSRQELGDLMTALARRPEINALWEKEQIDVAPSSEPNRKAARL